MQVKEFLARGADHYLPNLSIDVVIIGYEDKQLKCLLLRIGDRWLLPGGYIGREESVEAAAARILKDRTSLDDPHLHFLSVMGDRDRRFEREWRAFCEKSGLPWRRDSWLNDRFVTLVYYSLVNVEATHPVVKDFDEAAAWFRFDDLPAMWMDHRSIVLEARNRLKEDIKQQQVTYNLLPHPFTMPELHELHQVILEEKIDRSRFQKKMLATGLFERLPIRQKESPGRNPYQYTVTPDRAGATGKKPARG